jgi:hypothetical protein
MESPNGIEKAMKPVSCLESPKEIEKSNEANKLRQNVVSSSTKGFH